MFLSLLLLGCAPSPDAPADAAPADWFYADQGDAIAWDTVDYEAGDVRFRTVGPGLLSGPVEAPWVGALSCGSATRLTLEFEAGELVDTHSFPANDCVAGIADRLDWSGLVLDGAPVSTTRRALVVLDVPGEEVAWSSS